VLTSLLVQKKKATMENYYHFSTNQGSGSK
jgi:hypothetical protein